MSNIAYFHHIQDDVQLKTTMKIGGWHTGLAPESHVGTGSSSGYSISDQAWKAYRGWPMSLGPWTP